MDDTPEVIEVQCSDCWCKIRLEVGHPDLALDTYLCPDCKDQDEVFFSTEPRTMELECMVCGTGFNPSDPDNPFTCEHCRITDGGPEVT